MSLPIFALSKHLRTCVSIVLFSPAKGWLAIAPYIYFYIFFALLYSHLHQVIWFSGLLYPLQTMQWRPVISLSTPPLSSKENTLVTGVVFTTGNRSIMGRIVSSLWVCLVTLNSRPQPCKGKFGSSRRLFPLPPWNSFVSLWAAWLRNAFSGLKMLAVLSSTRLDVSWRSRLMYVIQNLSITTVMIIIIWTVTTCIQSANIQHNVIRCITTWLGTHQVV